MSKDATLLTIGNEILDGRVVDTNAVTLAKSFKEFGIEVVAKISVQDHKPAIISALNHLRATYPNATIICTGGLGPTADDLTRFAIAEYLDLELTANNQERLRLEEFYAARGRTLIEKNLVQTLFPQDSTLLINQVGTASGFISKDKDSKVIAIPGVPREIADMQSRLLSHILDIEPHNLEQYRHPQPQVFRFFGLPESYLATIVDSLLQEKPALEPSKVSYRASFPEVVIKIDHDFGYDSLLSEVGDSIGNDFIVSKKGETMVEKVAQLLTEQRAKIFVTESCTGGMLGSLLTDLPGASSYFYGGCITYDNLAKRNFIAGARRVRTLSPKNIALNEEFLTGQEDDFQDLLLNHGAVSHEMAAQLALSALVSIDNEQAENSSDHLLRNANIGVAITGIAGPDGGVLPDKPAGTFFVSVALSSGIHSFKFFFPTSRDRVRKYACWATLDLVRRALIGFDFDSWCESSRDNELKDKFPSLKEARRLL